MLLASNTAWPMVRLGEVCEIVGGGTPSTSKTEYWDGEIPWLTPKDLSGRKELYISRGTRMLTKEGLKTSGAKMLPSGTVLWSSRAPIGLVAISSNPIATNQGFKSFIPGARVHSEYLALVLISLRDELQNYGSGATFKEVSGKRAASIEVPLPPLAEQRRIAEILKASSDAKSLLNAKIAALRSIAKFDLHSNGSGNFLTFGDIVEIRSGQVDPSAPENRKKIHVAPDAIQAGEARLLALRSCEEDGVTSGKYAFHAGDVLYSKIRPYLNKVVIPQFEGLCSADMYALLPKEGFSPEFVQAVLMSEHFLAYANKVSGRASIPKINRKSLLSYEIPKPDESIVKKITAISRQVEKSIQSCETQLELTEELHRSLATRAFAGRL